MSKLVESAGEDEDKHEEREMCPWNIYAGAKPKELDVDTLH